MSVTIKNKMSIKGQLTLASTPAAPAIPARPEFSSINFQRTITTSPLRSMYTTGTTLVGTLSTGGYLEEIDPLTGASTPYPITTDQFDMGAFNGLNAIAAPSAGGVIREYDLQTGLAVDPIVTVPASSSTAGVSLWEGGSYWEYFAGTPYFGWKEIDIATGTDTGQTIVNIADNPSSCFIADGIIYFKYSSQSRIVKRGVNQTELGDWVDITGISIALPNLVDMAYDGTYLYILRTSTAIDVYTVNYT